nr:MarR family transcriptional regulator [Aurantiacibacter rhizosphaerae]
MDFHSAVFNRLNRVLLEEHGITLAKFDALAQLCQAPEGLTQGALSRKLKVTGGNVTGLTSRLAADGLITREMSPSDRRAFVVQVTPEGAQLYRAAQRRHDAFLHSLFDGIGDADLQQALQSLQILGQRADLNGRKEEP